MTVAQEPRQLPRPSTLQSPLSQSRETGDALPEKRPDGTTVTSKPAPVAKSWAHFVAGGLGGMTSTLLTSPLDVLKTRLQSTFYQDYLAASRAARGIPAPDTLPFARAALLHIRETFQILVAVPRAEGWRALFKGLGPNLVGVVPARAINFYAYGNGKRLYAHYLNNGRESASIHLLSAATAGIITGTATNPIWLVKTRLQLDKSRSEGPEGQGRQYRNALDCVRQTLRTEGIRGLYRGLSASYLGVTESTLQWVLYEQMKLYLATREQRLLSSGRDPTTWDQTVAWTGKLGAAGSAKFVAAIVMYPHEVVRTRLRQAPSTIDPVTGRPTLKYTGLLQCFKLIWKEEGLASMYGGLTPHMLRVVPSAAIMFGMYEGVLKLLGESSGV